MAKAAPAQKASLAAKLGVTKDNPIHPKVAAVGISGATVTVIIALLKRLFKIDVPPDVVTGAAAVVLFVIGFLKRGKK